MGESDVKGSKADDKGVHKYITKEYNTLMEEKIMIQNERHIEAQEQKLDSYTGGINAAISSSLLLISDKLLIISTSLDEKSDN